MIDSPYVPGRFYETDHQTLGLYLMPIVITAVYYSY